MTTLILTYLLNLFDLAMTTYWVRLYGLSIEANPIGRWLFENNLVWVFKVFIVGGLLAILGVCIRKCPKYAWSVYIPFTVYLLLAVYHTILIIII